MAQPWLPGAPHETVAAPSARCAVTLPTPVGDPAWHDGRRGGRLRSPAGPVARPHPELLGLPVGQVGPLQRRARRRVRRPGGEDLHLVLDDRVAAVARWAPADADRLVTTLADGSRRGVRRPQRVLGRRRRAELALALGVHGADHERVLLAVRQTLPAERGRVAHPLDRRCPAADLQVVGGDRTAFVGRRRPGHDQRAVGELHGRRRRATRLDVRGDDR